MSEERRPLEISEEVAAAAGVPDDLDSTQRQPYTIPSTRRRRVAVWVYLVGAAVSAGLVGAGLPAGLLVIGGAMVAAAAWNWASAWSIHILDPAALEEANRAIDFPVGHASAAIGFDTWRARPVWNVLVFDTAEPPARRGLVRVDAVDGRVVETYAERMED